MCTTSSNPTVLMSWTDYSQLLPKHDELEMSLLIINEFGMVCVADSTWGPTTRRKPLYEKSFLCHYKIGHTLLSVQGFARRFGPNPAHPPSSLSVSI